MEKDKRMTQGRQMSIKRKALSLFIPGLYCRPMIKTVKELNNGHRGLVGVEVGVAEGLNAYNILRCLDMRCLYLVDSYQGVWARSYPLARRLLRRYRDRIVFIDKDSVSAVECLPDSLDFVYLDGDHSYDGVYSDFYAYYPKIKDGGLIGGHDFNRHGLKGVVRFVGELYDRYGSRLVYATGDDWWMVKKS